MTTQEQAQEHRWVKFTVGLPPWYRHALTKGDLELRLHDEFMAGTTKLSQIKLVLAKACGE